MRPDQQHSAAEAEPLFNDGGPAFPSSSRLMQDGSRRFSEQITGGGMTLRDYFAGQALMGLIAANRPNMNRVDDPQIAYILADAMIAAREK